MYNYYEGNKRLNINDGFSKERAQVVYAVDRFFGTEGGFVYSEEKVNKLDDVGKVIGHWFKKLFKPDDSGKILNVFAELGRLHIMLCGGAITSTFTNAKINDLDFYVRDPDKLEEAREFLIQHFPIVINDSINATTFKRKSAHSNATWTVQLITKFHGSPDDIFDWFDFTVTHGAFDFATGLFHLGPRFLPDLSKRRLVYTGSSKYPICALYRTQKYVKRGFELPGATIMHIALSIVQLEIETYGDLKEQLMGIDTMYLQKVLDRYSPECPVNYGEFIEEAFALIDRIKGSTTAEEEDNEQM